MPTCALKWQPVQVQAVGRLIVRPSELQGVAIPRTGAAGYRRVPDGVCGCRTPGRATTLRERCWRLRHKESDRISVMVAGLRALGIEVDFQTVLASVVAVFVAGPSTAAVIAGWRSMPIGAARAAGPVQRLDTANVCRLLSGLCQTGVCGRAWAIKASRVAYRKPA